MAQTRTKTRVVNLTRNELIQGTAKRFLDIASDHGAGCDFYYDRLDVIIRMELITDLELIVSSQGEAVGGVTLSFDWDKHTAMVEANGEFIDPDIVNQFGTTDSITDTLELVRAYVAGLAKHYSSPNVNVWYTPNKKRRRELGSDRYDQIFGVSPKTDEDDRETQAEWAKIAATKAEKKRRVSTIGDLPETSIKAW